MENEYLNCVIYYLQLA